MTTEPIFPPLLMGEAVTGHIDPFDKAISMATLGCDAGTIVHNITPEYLRAAFIFAPEVTLDKATAMMVACSIGYSNALGALAPPEVAVHLDWHGGILVNGATCGALKIASSHDTPSATPDWLVVGLTVPLIPPNDDGGGHTPDQTSLFQEGCIEIEPIRLLESWSRHSLVWINRWSDDGSAPLHAEWRTMAHGIGEYITTDLNGDEITGTFLGIDEDFGMLIRSGQTTHIKPLSDLL
jgi:biotin-(acetyl-CoA carboxylase) ligase